MNRSVLAGAACGAVVTAVVVSLVGAGPTNGPVSGAMVGRYQIASGGTGPEWLVDTTNGHAWIRGIDSNGSWQDMGMPASAK